MRQGATEYICTVCLVLCTYYRVGETAWQKPKYGVQGKPQVQAKNTFNSVDVLTPSENVVPYVRATSRAELEGIHPGISKVNNNREAGTGHVSRTSSVGRAQSINGDRRYNTGNNNRKGKGGWIKGKRRPQFDRTRKWKTRRNDFSQNEQFDTRQKQGQFDTRQKQGQFDTRQTQGQFDTRQKQEQFDTRQKQGQFDTRQKQGQFDTRQKQGQFDTRQKQGQFDTRQKQGQFNNVQGNKAESRNRKPGYTTTASWEPPYQPQNTRGWEYPTTQSPPVTQSSYQPPTAWQPTNPWPPTTTWQPTTAWQPTEGWQQPTRRTPGYTYPTTSWSPEPEWQQQRTPVSSKQRPVKYQQRHNRQGPRTQSDRMAEMNFRSENTVFRKPQQKQNQQGSRQFSGRGRAVGQASRQAPSAKGGWNEQQGQGNRAWDTSPGRMTTRNFKTKPMARRWKQNAGQQRSQQFRGRDRAVGPAPKRGPPVQQQRHAGKRNMTKMRLMPGAEMIEPLEPPEPGAGGAGGRWGGAVGAGQNTALPQNQTMPRNRTNSKTAQQIELRTCLLEAFVELESMVMAREFCADVIPSTTTTARPQGRMWGGRGLNYPPVEPTLAPPVSTTYPAWPFSTTEIP